MHELPEKYNMAARSRILKTKMRELIAGDFLYIDCDTIICESLENIQNIKNSAAVLDGHSRVTTDLTKIQLIIERAERFHFSVGYHDKHFNSGVLWCKDDEKTKTFFQRWNRLRYAIQGYLDYL